LNKDFAYSLYKTHIYIIIGFIQSILQYSSSALQFDFIPPNPSIKVIIDNFAVFIADLWKTSGSHLTLPQNIKKEQVPSAVFLLPFP
jgi:hypothetical protein